MTARGVILAFILIAASRCMADSSQPRRSLVPLSVTAEWPLGISSEGATVIRSAGSPQRLPASFEVPPNAAQTLVIVDKAGRPLLMGIIAEPPRQREVVVSMRTTAAALVLLHPILAAERRGQRSVELFARIERTRQFDTLVERLGGELARTGNLVAAVAPLADAVAAAVDAALAAGAREKVTITPGPQSGVSVSAISARLSSTIEVRNERRRFVALWLEDAAGPVVPSPILLGPSEGIIAARPLGDTTTRIDVNSPSLAAEPHLRVYGPGGIVGGAHDASRELLPTALTVSLLIALPIANILLGVPDDCQAALYGNFLHLIATETTLFAELGAGAIADVAAVVGAAVKALRLLIENHEDVFTSTLIQCYGTSILEAAGLRRLAAALFPVIGALDVAWRHLTSGPDLPLTTRDLARSTRYSEWQIANRAELHVFAAPLEGPAPLPVDFAVTCGGDVCASATWRFGDGASSMGDRAIHTFSRAGVYTVVVTATDSAGAEDTQYATVVVRDPAGSCVPSCPADEVCVRFGPDTAACRPRCTSSRDCPAACCAALEGGGGACVSREQCNGGCGVGCSTSEVCIPYPNGAAACQARCQQDGDCGGASSCLSLEGGGGACVSEYEYCYQGNAAPCADCIWSPSDRVCPWFRAKEDCDCYCLFEACTCVSHPIGSVVPAC